MFLNRNKNGYGWYAQVKTKEGESENVAYLSFSFKKGCEPDRFDLTEYGSYEGELIFRDRTGKERKVFPLAKEYNGTKHVEFKLLEAEGEYKDPQPSWQPKTEAKWDMSTETTYTDKVTEDDLPFI